MFLIFFYLLFFFFNVLVELVLDVHCEHTLIKKKKEAFPPFFRVAFQQGSVHCITKLLRGFQNMSKAC